MKSKRKAKIENDGPNFIIESNNHDLFLVFDHELIAWHPGTDYDPCWISLEPGFAVRERDGGDLIIEYEGVMISAMALRRDDFLKLGKPRCDLLRYAPCLIRDSNSYESEAKANVARIISTARNIAIAFKFDNSPLGEQMRETAAETIELWERCRIELWESFRIQHLDNWRAWVKEKEPAHILADLNAPSTVQRHPRRSVS